LYVSGSPLSETSTYLGATFASLGVTPGQYVYTWGSGDHADSFTINIGASPVPEPSTWAMMLIGFAGLGYAALKHKRVPAVTKSQRCAPTN
jgi:PEP-CTERM motif